MRPANVHNLPGNAKVSSPHEVVILDTETFEVDGTSPTVYSMRLWCAVMRRRHDKNPNRPRREETDGDTSAELVQWLDSQVKGSPTVWVFAHNLSFDLAVTRLVPELMDRGWTVGSHNLASERPWAIMHHGSKTIRLCDSFSFLPYSAATIGQAVGVHKPDLPSDDDERALWLHRCRQDVAIIETAIISLMDWWDANELGNFSTTGPRTGWNAMAHMCVRRRGEVAIRPRGPASGQYLQHGDGHVVIDPNPEARVFERATLYQGRREAWRVGELPAGMYAELDFRRAHLTVAAELRLPCRRGKSFSSLSVDVPFLDNPNIGMIADVEIETDQPRYPVRAKHGITHPVGRFWTRLAGPEILEARRRGELRAVGAGYYYRMSYHMQPWALWLAHLVDGDDPATPAAVHLAARAWSRTVFGTWAGRSSRVAKTGTSPEMGWLAEPCIDAATGSPAVILHLHGQWSYVLRDQETDNSFPAVLSYIQSYVRLGLNAVIDTLGPDRVLSCNTDAVVVDVGRTRRTDTDIWRGLPGPAAPDARVGKLCGRLLTPAWPLIIRPKGVHQAVRVLSPQHLKLDTARRFSGVPKGAIERERDYYVFETWPKLARQMTLNDPRGYVREQRHADLRRMLTCRWVAVDGCTAPPAMATGPERRNRVLVPASAGCAAHGQPWADRQWRDFPPVPVPRA